MGRVQDLTTDKLGASPMKVNIPNSSIRFAALEEEPTKVELVSWSIYGLCSYFAQAFLIPVLFPLLLGQTVHLSANYENEWHQTFPDRTCSQSTIIQYERLVHSSVSIGGLKISPLLLTGCVWAVTTAIVAPILPSLSPLLDYGNKQPIFVVLSSAVGIIACLPPGIFINTWAVAAFLALAITGSSLSSMAYNRHLALMIRASATSPTVPQHRSSISYMRDHFHMRQTAGGLLSSTGTAAESIGAAVLAIFTYKMLGFESAVRLGVWITCILAGILWAVGAAQAFLLQPVRSGPDFSGGKFNPARGWIDAFGIRKFPNAVTSAVLVFLASFAGSCAFASGILHALGSRCFEPKYILFMWLAYFLAPGLSAVVTGLLPRILFLNGRQMQVIGFMLVAGVSTLGFIQYSWRPWWAIVGAGVLGLGVGILNSYGRTLFFDFIPPSKEGAFLVWFSIIKGAGLCAGFIVGCVRSRNIRMAFCSSLVSSSSGLLLLIFGNVGNFGGFVNAGHVKERVFLQKKEEKDHRINVDGQSKTATQNERVSREEVVELEPDNSTLNQG